MSESNEPITQAGEAQTQAGLDPQELLQKIQYLEANNAKLLDEKKSMAEREKEAVSRFDKLNTETQQASQAYLIQNQEFEKLWQEAKGTNARLEETLAQKDREIEELKQSHAISQVRSTAQQLCTQNGVLNPEIMLSSPAFSQLRSTDDGVVALIGGVEVPLQQHLDNLKQPGSGYEMMFGGSGAKGMSSSGTAPNQSTGGKSWSTMSFTEKVAVQVHDRENGTNYEQRLRAAG